MGGYDPQRAQELMQRSLRAVGRTSSNATPAPPTGLGPSRHRMVAGADRRKAGKGQPSSPISYESIYRYITGAAGRSRTLHRLLPRQNIAG